MMMFLARNSVIFVVIRKSVMPLICYQCNSANVPSHLIKPGKIAFPFGVTNDNVPTLEF